MHARLSHHVYGGQGGINIGHSAIEGAWSPVVFQPSILCIPVSSFPSPTFPYLFFALLSYSLVSYIECIWMQEIQQLILGLLHTFIKN